LVPRRRRRRAGWLASVWRDLGITGTVHVRRVHYISGSHGDVPWINGGNYENTEKHWKALSWGVRDARYLGLIPDDGFEDRRNAEPIIYITNHAALADLGVVGADVEEEGAYEMPSSPELFLTAPSVDQRVYALLSHDKLDLASYRNRHALARWIKIRDIKNANRPPILRRHSGAADHADEGTMRAIRVAASAVKGNREARRQMGR